jgi:hypothetical protein
VYWLDAGLKQAVPPIAALLWIHGAYLALSIVLAEVVYAEAAALVAAGWLKDVGTMATLFWLLSRLGRVIEARLTPLASLTASTWDDALLPVAGKAARVLLPILALILGVPALSVSPELQTVLRNGLSLVLIGAVAFMLYQLVEAAEALVLQRYRLDESVRQFGTSILASAGIAGIIIGFAAQRSIATLLAGLQIAVTQPIRLDDVVIVENEWGRIEDISLTYVIVRIWDQRRLVVPITYFIEQPFQNWTRSSAEILGTVFFHLDYRAPLDAIRRKLDEILAESPYWDGKVKVLQVTDAKEHTLEVRALASAADASLAWDLRCEVREKLIQFLQEHHPESLPRMRAELHSAESPVRTL